MFLYNFSRALVRFFDKLVFFLKIKGDRKLPDGPVIICANHISFNDPVAIAAAVDRRIMALAKSTLFEKPFLGWFFKKLGVIPVQRSGGDFAAVRTAVNLLKQSKVLLIFPQGTRCPGAFPDDRKVRGGVAMIAAKTNAAIVPVFIGTKKFKVRPFRKVELIIGDPFFVSELYDGKNDKNFVELSKGIFSRVLSLAEEKK